ncbi:hypothetical protein D9619_009684 [Psilocybe cf. subviscida]|uniref:Uncharacterized protein n=1 Tax=Psilocybe cf. subviscida TaxID=2480587 RepID=A0A8H5F6J7_9AGAR|nr:hypothetical protein D9619_009684 [Psilocybe cf. subviscida]
MYPAPMTQTPSQPAVVLQPGMMQQPVMGMLPDIAPVITRTRSRSHSTQPIIVNPQAPTQASHRRSRPPTPRYSCSPTRLHSRRGSYRRPTRSLSPYSSRGRSPHVDYRHRDGSRTPERRLSPVSRRSTTRRAQSEGPTRRSSTPPARSRHDQAVGLATASIPISERTARHVPSGQSTVPPRREHDAHSPPTVVHIEDELPHGPTVGTSCRPSEGAYSTSSSMYSFHDEGRGRPAETIPGIEIVPNNVQSRVFVPAHDRPLSRAASQRGQVAEAALVTHADESVIKPYSTPSACPAQSLPADECLQPSVHRVPTASVRSQPATEFDQRLHSEPSAAPGEQPIVRPNPRRVSATPFDFSIADDSRGQLEELNDAANRLRMVGGAAEEAEDQRELEFLTHEEQQEHIFHQNEEQWNVEAREGGTAIWNDLGTRLAALPLPPDPSPAAGEAFRESIPTIRAIATQAASQYTSDILQMVREERSTLLAEMKAEKDRLVQEKDARIQNLEEKLTSLRAEIDAEKQQRWIEEAEIREQCRQQFAEYDQAVREQLSDLTNLLQDQRSMLEEKREESDMRYEEKKNRRNEKRAVTVELRDMVHELQRKINSEREDADASRAENKDALDRIVDNSLRHNTEQRELLIALSEGWRADCERQHNTTIEAVKASLNEHAPFNVQAHLDRFMKALATEVRMLLGEVGKIREEKRALEFEIGDLLSIKAKFGPGGEYEAHWKPPAPQPPPQPPFS